MEEAPTKTFHSKIYPTIDPKLAELSTKGKIIFITGGGAGVGAALSRSFAIAGATDIAIIRRRAGLLNVTKTALEAEFPGLSVFTRVADVLNRAAIDGAFADFSAKVGPIDILIHNINIKGSLIVAQAFLAHAAKGAKVIYLTTAMAIIPPMLGASAYASSKLGATKVFEYLQAENPDLCVISVHPGVLQTEMQDKLINDGITIPQDEMSLPAGSVLWAASPEAEFMKGKFLWSNWDVTELKARAEEIKGTNLLSLSLGGFPFTN